MKRNFTVTITSPSGAKTERTMVAEEMKSLDCAVILLDWNEESLSYVEVGFFRYDKADKVDVLSVPVE